RFSCSCDLPAEEKWCQTPFSSGHVRVGHLVCEKWCLTPFFRTIFPCLYQLVAHPLELARHVIDDVARLQVLGQHVPRVRLDLEMRRELVRLVELQRVLDREAGRLEVAEIIEEHRHVEVR